MLCILCCSADDNSLIATTLVKVGDVSRVLFHPTSIGLFEKEPQRLTTTVDPHVRVMLLFVPNRIKIISLFP